MKNRYTAKIVIPSVKIYVHIYRVSVSFVDMRHISNASPTSVLRFVFAAGLFGGFKGGFGADFGGIGNNTDMALQKVSAVVVRRLS